ncbi:hypothetical protein [Bacillus testis]|uniref:hypothetical protein n=1 Tax=Bacillus testis TaxID=1622072 RepID=UPI0008412062|nr:hypothetical protein [Bacillus testis]
MPYWNFPAVIGGNINSINNAGLETFRDNALDSLTREICQNSLDAVKDVSKPVTVEFNQFTAETTLFPGKGEMVEVFRACEETWKNKNKKSEEFIDQALELLGKKNLNFLRVSDFNTIGLKGAKEAELGSPWSSLVKEAGSSNKGDESGGSFGIGKAAPFLNSQLRTLFYSSLDEDGYASHIGVANIMSFIKKNQEITVGNGYFTDHKDSRAIEGLIHIDHSFERAESGTDIFIAAFEPGSGWEQEIIRSILHNFFITVFRKKLVVKVNDFTISHENLDELIGGLEDNEENRILKNYYRLLSSEDTIKVPYPARSYKRGIAFEEGEAELLLMEGEDLNRRVLMTRKTGMRLFEQKNINGSISFTGLFMITGSHMNSLFKQLENPAHNGWMPNRYEKDPKLANKIYADLRKFIREQVKELFNRNTADVMDAVGLSDFLPNRVSVSEQGKNKTESINSTIKSITYKKKEQQPKKKQRKKGTEPSDIDEQLLGEFGIGPGESGGNGFSEGGQGGDAGGGTSETEGKHDVDEGAEGNLSNEKKKSPKTTPVASKQKYICNDKANGAYQFMISPDKALQKGELKFTVMGEQSDFDLPVRIAHFMDSDIHVERIAGNTVHFTCDTKKKNLNIRIEVDYSEYCAMEVEVYEVK